MSSTSTEKYWYNLKTGAVEKGMLSPGVDRVGPFETESEASNALNLLRERSAAWDEDERENA